MLFGCESWPKRRRTHVVRVFVVNHPQSHGPRPPRTIRHLLGAESAHELKATPSALVVRLQGLEGLRSEVTEVKNFVKHVIHTLMSPRATPPGSSLAFFPYSSSHRPASRTRGRILLCRAAALNTIGLGSRSSLRDLCTLCRVACSAVGTRWPWLGPRDFLEGSKRCRTRSTLRAPSGCGGVPGAFVASGAWS